ncbi:competence protein CoiA [Polymorphobacter megasporae]|uniref:competence protein CoiA n=1 Tax=Glacieibacterium megasporae TaxID=2835787 RepID=UPI001C1E79D5|nr:competence protein CoiA [Polymorphobacter megasporae]UAJ10074.1 competence protein CoiA [Polymorphobacter megasporae]
MMPLRCLDDADRSLDAVALSPLEWAALTATNRHVRHLRMHCCGSPVALKTSRLGTRFFAHFALGGCASGDESPEHLHLKALAITAARAAGWTAEAEVSGTTSGGEPWRADVLATRGKHRVAVEVQWSGQADDETARRQARYAASGVRALWLFRRPGFAIDPDVPAVRVRGTLAAGLTVQGLPVADFLAAVFDRRLKFGIPSRVAAKIVVGGIVVTCYGLRCGAFNRAVERVVVSAGTNDCHMALSHLSDHLGPRAAVLATLPRDKQRGPIRLRTLQGRTYLANTCFSCGLPFGEAYLTDLNSRWTIASTTIVIDKAWAASIAAVHEFDPVWSVVARDPAFA